VDVQIHIFLASAVVGGVWSTLRPGPLYPPPPPGAHWIGGWVDLRAGLDDLEKGIFLTLPGLELRPLGRPASRYTDYTIPAPHLQYDSTVFPASLFSHIYYSMVHKHVPNVFISRCRNG
jgi:hypothetical protein